MDGVEVLWTKDLPKGYQGAVVPKDDGFDVWILHSGNVRVKSGKKKKTVQSAKVAIHRVGHKLKDAKTPAEIKAAIEWIRAKPGPPPGPDMVDVRYKLPRVVYEELGAKARAQGMRAATELLQSLAMMEVCEEIKPQK